MSSVRALAFSVLAMFAGGQGAGASLQARVTAHVDAQAAALAAIPFGVKAMAAVVVGRLRSGPS